MESTDLLCPLMSFVDFLSNVLGRCEFSALGDVIKAVIASPAWICSETDLVRLILDSYIEMSLKEGERMRHRDSSTGIDRTGTVAHPFSGSWMNSRILICEQMESTATHSRVRIQS